MTPAWIEPATFRFVAQHLNHCVTVQSEVLLFNYYCYCVCIMFAARIFSDTDHVTVIGISCSWPGGKYAGA